MVQYAFFVLLLAIFVAGSAFNAAMLWKAYVRKVKHSTLIPFLPGIAGVGSFCLSPYPILWLYAWLPLVIDPGSALSIVLAFAVNLPYMYATNPLFRVARLQSSDCECASVLITLYSSGMYILKKETSHPRTMLSHIGDWSIDNDILKLSVGSKPVEYNIVRESGLRGSVGARLDWQATSASSVLDEVSLRLVSGRLQ